MAKTKTVLKEADLKAADEGWFYTIIGAGGPLQDWVDGIEKLLAEKGIGKPVAWFRTTGAAVNDYIRPGREQDAFEPDLTILMFPLDGLDPGKLAIFKLQMKDRWFNDVVDNARAWREGAE